MRRLQIVALHATAAGFGVAGVQVQPMSSGNQRQSFVQVRTQFVGRAGLAQVVAGHGQAPAQFLAALLETADIVALPAVQGNRYAGQHTQGRVHIHAELGVVLTRLRKSTFHPPGFVSHRQTPARMQASTRLFRDGSLRV